MIYVYLFIWCAKTWAIIGLLSDRVWKRIPQAAPWTVPGGCQSFWVPVDVSPSMPFKNVLSIFSTVSMLKSYELKYILWTMFVISHIALYSLLKSFIPRKCDYLTGIYKILDYMFYDIHNILEFFFFNIVFFYFHPYCIFYIYLRTLYARPKCVGGRLFQ